MPKQKAMKRTSKSATPGTLELAREYRLHPADNRRVIENYFVALGTPVALSCYMLYKYGEYDQLVSKEIHPSRYNDGETFRDDFAAVSFLRKHETLKTSFDRKKNALLTFSEGEASCKETNTRIRRYLLGSKENCPDERQLNAVIRKIGTILGDFDVDRFLDLCRWGPGTTIACKGDDTSGARKFDDDCDFTADAYDLFGPVMREAYPLWERLKNPVFRTGNTISTVAKNAKTDRTIAVEPGCNSWIQSGIGRLIRGKLRSFGYNLNSDLKNQRGAYIGSIDGSLATVDFKAASDTISIETVRLLIPPKWFQILDAARSQSYTLQKRSFRSEKFSTMGNGFTFELESLIFLAIGLGICQVLGVADDGVSIFGDDLVVPAKCVAELIPLCTFLGFTINETKSFWDGPFRESCGTYYFNGLDVKPLYFKTDLLYVKDLFRMANAIRGLSHSFAVQRGCDIRFRSVWSLVVHLLPAELRLKGPVCSGDAAIHHNIDESSPRVHRDKDGETGWFGHVYTGLPDVPIDIEKESLGLHLAKLRPTSRDRSGLYGLFGDRRVYKNAYNHRIFLQEFGSPETQLLGNRVSLRERTRMLLKKNMFAQQWYTFGPWLNTSTE